MKTDGPRRNVPHEIDRLISDVQLRFAREVIPRVRALAPAAAV